MLEARIISPRGSLYVAAEATAYDVENLRAHLRALTLDPRQVRVELRVGKDGATLPALSTWIAELTIAGVQVRYLPLLAARRGSPSRGGAAPGSLPAA